jgi:hypothetical protein
VTSVPLAHVGGIPIEETLGSLGPALLLALGVAWANLRARLRRARSRQRARPPRKKGRAARPLSIRNSDDESGALAQRRHTASDLHPGETAPHEPRRATPLLLAANASVRTCTEFAPATDEHE